MEMHLVASSSMIQAYAYDPAEQVLLILFNSGKAYRYFDVPPEVYEGLHHAESKGRYLKSHVIDCYSYALAKKPWVTKTL